MSGRNAGGAEDLAAKLKEAWDTNRRLHRRLQAVEGPTLRALEEARAEARYWYDRRVELGQKVRALRDELAGARAAAAPRWLSWIWGG